MTRSVEIPEADLLAQLPRNPVDLLTTEQHEELRIELARLARLRRDAEAASRDLVLP